MGVLVIELGMITAGMQSTCQPLAQYVLYSNIRANTKFYVRYT